MRHIETAAAVGEVRGIPFVVSRIRGNSNKKKGNTKWRSPIYLSSIED